MGDLSALFIFLQIINRLDTRNHSFAKKGNQKFIKVACLKNLLCYSFLVKNTIFL